MHSLGTLGSPRAMQFAPQDVPDDPEASTSLQPLGAAQVLVEWIAGDFGAAEVVGAWIAGELVDADAFSKATVERWSLAIEREIERDAAEVEWD